MDYWQSDLNAVVRKGYSQDRSAGHVNAAIFLMDIHYVLWTRAVNRDYFSVQVRRTAFLLHMPSGFTMAFQALKFLLST